MRSWWRRILGYGCVLLLAGCFQQAGESLQDTSSLSEPIQQDLDPTPTLPDVDATPQLVIATSAIDDTAAPDAAATDVPTRPATGPTLPPITVIVQPTNAPVTPTDPNAPTPINLSGEGGFITPVSPLGAAFETSQPESSGGGSPATPSGLITPTDIFSSIGGSSASTSSECTYTVERGDTVYRIALDHDTTVAAMREANPDLTGENPVIQPGDVLNLPECNGDTGGDVMVETQPTDIPPIVAPSGGSEPSGQTETYTVQRGDTLFIIAQRFGTTVAAIVEANALTNPDRLSVGQLLIIPND